MAAPVAPNCLLCPVRASCFFVADLSGDDLEAFMAARLGHRAKRGQVVFYEGHRPHGVYVVCKGRVKIYQSDRQGHLLTVEMADPGDLLGYVALLADGPYTATAEAIEESTLSFVDESRFRAVLNRFPSIGAKLTRRLARAVSRLSRLAGEMGTETSRERLVNLLYALARKYGDSTGQETRIALKLTRQELGELTGLAQETVMRLLGDLESEGKVSLKGKVIMIKNLKAFGELATAQREIDS